MSDGDSFKRTAKGTFAKRGYFNRIANLPINAKSQVNDNINKSNENQSNWTEGRRVIELGFLAEQLKHCKQCHSPLFLHNCKTERRYGLGSILYIQCEHCPYVNQVSTGKRHREDSTKRGMQIWDINTKLSLAYIDAGMGPNQTVNFLAALNIPPITANNLKEREREIGKIIEHCTDTSCKKALQEEVALSKLDQQETNENRIDEVCIAFDGGWQKRGSGRSYSSLTGHATMIGERSGKCVKRGVKSTDCKKCLYINEKGDADHDCRRNHTGSAKSMESALAVDMAKDLEKDGCRISCIIMDDDSTTIARLRKTLNYEIEKKGDRNHNRKNIVGDLYKLHEKFKGSLPTTTINYLTKNIDYAIAQNKADPKGLERALQSIVPHAFGDHSKCLDSWCNYLRNPDSYKHKSLPHGKDLSGDALCKDLSVLFNQYSKSSEKMSNLGSSQANESLNQNIAMKAPKFKHFGGSESLNFRVSAAVIQKNEGRSYIPQVYQAHNLSPGKFTQKHIINIDKKRKKKREISCLPESKKIRVERKQTKSVKTKVKEIREGTTYATAIGSMEVSENEIIHIPDPVPEFQAIPIQLQNQINVFFDFETTGFGTECDVIQIAACYNDQCFNRYMVPPKKITASASKVTGFTKSGLVLFKKGEIVITDTKGDSFKDFVEWIPRNSILIGHNSRAFDAKILVKALVECDLLESFQDKCNGFVDTLPMFKEILPERKKEKKSFSQENLVADLLGITYEAHDAVGDVKALEKLFESVCITKCTLEKQFFSSDYIISNQKQTQETNTRLETLTSLSSQTSKQMLRKIASSGLELSHLKLAHDRGQKEGIRQLLGEELSNGKPRVTKNKKTINSIVSFFDSKVQ